MATPTKWEMVSLVFEMGFIIALPLLVLSQLGKYLDARWGTDPWMVLLGIVLAIIATTLWLARRFRSMITM